MFLFSFYRVTVLIKKKPDVHSREKVTLHLECSQITLFHVCLRNSTFETWWWLVILKKVYLKQFLTHDHWLTAYHIKLCKSFKKLFQSSNVELGLNCRGESEIFIQSDVQVHPKAHKQTHKEGQPVLQQRMWGTQQHLYTTGNRTQHETQVMVIKDN